MRRSIRDNTKKAETRGRKKTTGPGELIGVRLHGPQIKAIDQWAAAQPDSPSRPEAIRRLIDAAIVDEKTLPKK
jgi:hypothetical protein